MFQNVSESGLFIMALTLLVCVCVCVFLEVWDMRKGTAMMDLKNHEDYISDITVDQAKRMLLTARYWWS